MSVTSQADIEYIKDKRSQSSYKTNFSSKKAKSFGKPEEVYLADFDMLEREAFLTQELFENLAINKKSEDKRWNEAKSRQMSLKNPQD